MVIYNSSIEINLLANFKKSSNIKISSFHFLLYHSFIICESIKNKKRDKISLGDKMNLKHSEKYKKIGIKISEYRNKKGLTQEQLANEVGISYSYLTQIEAPNVVKKMSLEVLFDIADVLDVDVKELI